VDCLILVVIKGYLNTTFAQAVIDLGTKVISELFVKINCGLSEYRPQLHHYHLVERRGLSAEVISKSELLIGIHLLGNFTIEFTPRCLQEFASLLLEIGNLRFDVARCTLDIRPPADALHGRSAVD
jgi:hypothetical protein